MAYSLGVEIEDEGAEGEDCLIQQVTHGNEGEKPVEKNPAWMKVPPARNPQMMGFSGMCVVFSDDESQRDQRGKQEDESTDRYLPSKPVLQTPILHG